MKQLLNTLFVTSEDAYLSLENDNVVVQRDKTALAKIPLRSLEQILSFSYKGASPALIEKCSQIEFDLCIWTYLGRWGTDVICVSAEMRFCLNHYLVKNVSFLRSLPARGVWIEIGAYSVCDTGQ